MWNFIDSVNYPEVCEYIEKIIPDHLEDLITYAGSVEFRFRQHADKRGYTFPIPGIRTNKRIEYKIETNSDMPFKAGDQIRFELSDLKKYTITNIEYMVDEKNKDEYVFVNQSWPGFAKDDIKIKIITIE